MTSWIVDNAEKRKIAYSAHTGDIAENWNNGDGTNEEQQAQATREFEFASTQMKKLDDAGIPNGVLPGNHDNLRGANADLYNTYFGASRYEALSRTTDAPFYGDNQGAGDDNTNHYDLFTEGGQDFIALYLGYNVNQTEMDWANRILKANKGRNAILLTHDYLKPSQKPDGSDAPHTDEGERLFKNVVAPNENVFLVLAGHTHGNGLNIKKDVGVKNRNVVEMLADRQFFQIDGERRAGFLRLLQFDTDRAELSVNTYSPYLDNHNAIEFDTQAGRDYTESVDEFTVPIDLNSRTTAFRTDALQLATEVPRAIGSDAVQTGEEATTQWKGLSPNTRYGWFTRASDQDTGTQVSPVFTFTTGERGNGGKDGGKDQSRPGMDDPRYKNTKERFRVASQDG
nr:metallophosphoesterase [Arthrobacter roseus]